jgi:hypothetical protein
MKEFHQCSGFLASSSHRRSSPAPCRTSLESTNFPSIRCAAYSEQILSQPALSAAVTVRQAAWAYSNISMQEQTAGVKWMEQNLLLSRWSWQWICHVHIMMLHMGPRFALALVTERRGAGLEFCKILLPLSNNPSISKRAVCRHRYRTSSETICQQPRHRLQRMVVISLGFSWKVLAGMRSPTLLASHGPKSSSHPSQ